MIVDSTADLLISVKRILWSKLNAAGQICVASDYVLVQKSIIPEFLEACKEALATFFPDIGGALKSDSYSRIVSDLHFKRLKGLLVETNGRTVVGGNWNEQQRQIEPTIVVDVEPGDALMNQ